MERFITKYNVSRETFDRLKAYEAALHEWQKKLNLVSNSSLEKAVDRHFLDSAQLFQYIPSNAKILFDLGSGAGFPGMVLAVMAAEKLPSLKINLVESIKKKTVYLNAVKEAVGINVNIINYRIENCPKVTVDVFTSRAMCSLDKLLSYVFRFSDKKTLCIFPKGRSYKEELKEALHHWSFSCKTVANEYDPEGVILLINNISQRKGVK